MTAVANLANTSDLAAGIVAPWKPIPKTPGYRLGLAALAAAMLCLPLVYLGLIAGIVGAVWWHLAEHTSWFSGPRRGPAAILLLLVYLVPVFVGGCAVLFMLKPLLAPRARREQTFSLERFEEPRLYAFVDMVCELIGAPAPRRIDVDGRVNASAGFRRGWVSMLSRDDLVLTIGMPLVAGMGVRDFAGVLTHEFGHFAQGAGMRASYLIRTVMHWLARAAYERDGWDEALEAASHVGPASVQLVVAFMRLGVWTGRLVPRVLVRIAWVLGAYQSRQMEFDADRYASRFSGSESAERTWRRIAELSASFDAAEGQAVEMWRRHRQLPDDLPSLVADAADRLPPEIRERTEELMGEERTGLGDTHPSTRTRIAHVRALAEPGVFRLDAPASVLFSDFAGACKKASYGHYKFCLGGDLFKATFVPSTQILGDRRAEAARLRAVAAYVGFEPPTWRPFFAPIAEILPPEDPKRTLARLREARKRGEAQGPGAAEAAAAFYRASDRLVRCGQAQTLINLGFGTVPKSLGLRQATRQGVAQETERSREEMITAAGVIDGVLELAGIRLASALRLLFVKGAERRVRGGEAKRKRAPELLRALSAVREAFNAVRELHEDGAKAVALAEAVVTDRHAERAVRTLKELSDAVRDRLDDVRRITGGIPYPWETGLGATNLGEHIVGDTPAFRDFAEIFGTAGGCVTRYREVRARLIAELVEIAREVEIALGLDEAPVKADAAAQGQAAGA